MDNLEFGGYYFVKISEEHYRDLNIIAESAFGKGPGEMYYFLKNKTSLFGESNLGFIAYSKETNEPSAFYGVYSYPITLKGKNILAVQSGDTMTHKSHTGKGLFTLLAKKTYQYIEESGVQFVFGFPNDNSLPGFTKKLGWIQQGCLKNIEIKVRSLPIAKAAKKFSLINFLLKIYLKIIVNVFYRPDFDKIDFSSNNDDNFCVNHIKDFIHYKSFLHNFIIKINSHHIWVKYDGNLIIGDIEKSAIEEIELVFKSIKRFAFITGADKIVFGVSENSIWYSKLAGKYRVSDGIYYGYRKFNDKLNMNDFSFVTADLDTF